MTDVLDTCEILRAGADVGAKTAKEREHAHGVAERLCKTWFQMAGESAACRGGENVGSGTASDECSDLWRFVRLERDFVGHLNASIDHLNALVPPSERR